MKMLSSVALSMRTPTSGNISLKKRFHQIQFQESISFPYNFCLPTFSQRACIICKASKAKSNGCLDSGRQIGRLDPSDCEFSGLGKA
jgi:hypothetical protein